MSRTTLPLLSPRRVVVSGAILMALTLVVAAWGVPGKAKAISGGGTATATFNNPAPILIPGGADLTGPCSTGATAGAAAPYPSTIRVGTFPQGSVHILDVNLTLKNYSHTRPDDVDVLLVHGTRNRTVMSDAGGSVDASNIQLVLDDEAPNPLPNGSPILAGTFKPTNFTADDGFPSPAPTQNNASALSGFDNQYPNGAWKLYVQDDATLDCGTFAGGWSLRIKASVPG